MVRWRLVVPDEERFPQLQTAYCIEFSDLLRPSGSEIKVFSGRRVDVIEGDGCPCVAIRTHHFLNFDDVNPIRVNPPFSCDFFDEGSVRISTVTKECAATDGIRTSEFMTDERIKAEVSISGILLTSDFRIRMEGDSRGCLCDLINDVTHCTARYRTFIDGLNSSKVVAPTQLSKVRGHVLMAGLESVRTTHLDSRDE
jgi:hypothetical protein